MPNISKEELDELISDFKSDGDFDSQIDSATKESVLKGLDEETLPISPSQSGTYQLPIKGGQILSRFVTKEESDRLPGMVASTTRHPHGHEAVDIIIPGYDKKSNSGMGAPVYPIGPGKVIKTTSEGGDNKKGGVTCTIEHSSDKGLVSYYAHLLKLNVSVGDEVNINTVIGLNGDTGSAKGTSPHVHLSTTLNGKKINPLSDVIGKEFGTLNKKASLAEKVYKIACIFEKLIKNN